MKYCLLFFLSFSVMAHENCPDGFHQELSEVLGLANVVNELNWWPVTPKQVEKAYCRRGIPTEQEMESFIQRQITSSTRDKRVHGFRMKDENRKMIDAFEDLTTRQGIYGGRAVDPQINIQEAYGLNPDCERARCALDRMYGPSLARKILFLKFRYGFNASHLAYSNTRPITEAEIDDVLIAFGDLHPSMQNLGRGGNQRLLPSPNPDPDVPRAAANSGIALFPGWVAATAPNRQYMIFHEIAHNLSVQADNLDTSDTWLQMSGWVKLGDEWQMGSDACKVSEYGTHTPMEDFAETITAYRYNPQYLQSKCPAKYALIRDNVFRGIEYTSPEACQTAN